MSASSYPGLKFNKGDHASVAIDRVRKDRRSKDERESDTVRERSKGRCEIAVIGEGLCRLAAVHVHHMIGGRMRGRGASALAQHKQAACDRHHRDITGSIGGKKLQRVGDKETPWWTDRYRRVK